MSGYVYLSHLYSRNAEPDAPGDEEHAGHSSERDAGWHQFFEEDERREADDPVQVHDAAEEQEGHEEPTAAEAERAVLDAHPERAGGSGAKIVGQELDRGPAVAQARRLERGQLPDTGRQQQDRSKPLAGRHHHR